MWQTDTHHSPTSSSNPLVEILQRVEDAIAPIGTKERRARALQAYVARLGAYDISRIDRTANVLIDTWQKNYFPKIADFLEVLGKVDIQIRSTSDSADVSQVMHDDKVAKVKKSEIYTQALLEGWASDLILATRRQGKADWGAADASTFRYSLRSAQKAAESINDSTPLSRRLLNIWVGFRSREAALCHEAGQTDTSFLDAIYSLSNEQVKMLGRA